MANKGQILVVVLLILSMLLIVVPVMILQNQTESKWSVKGTQSTTAFHVAEAAQEKAYLVVTISTTTWESIQAGTILTNYRFDKKFTDLQGGEYTVWIASTSKKNSVEVISIARDELRKEIRSIRAVYSKNPLGAVAIDAGSGVALTGNNFKVEWGAVVTPKEIDSEGRSHPQFWSAANIDLDGNGAFPPNCDSPDCCQWHSWNGKLPPQPLVDLDYYKTQATGTNTYFPSISGNYCFASLGSDPRGREVMHAGFVPPAWDLGAPAQAGSSMGGGGSCDTTNKDTGYVYYVEDSLDIQAPGVYIRGSLVVTGNLNLPNGNFGNTDVTTNLPTDAWRQYCRDWSYYRTTFDSSAASSWPGLGSEYTSPSTTTYTVAKVFVQGFLYVGGDVTASGGGGNGAIIGAVIVKGAVTIGSNSNAGVYYNKDTADAIQTSTLYLGRDSWQEQVKQWPSGL